MVESRQNHDIESITFEHPAFGDITGRLNKKVEDDSLDVPAVAHFRSIPYATIPGRFKQSVLLADGLPEHYDERPKGDFREYGYACPQIPQPYDAVGGKLPGEGDRRYDELKCLNLTVSAPYFNLRNVPVGRCESSAEKKLLPVMVYVHGGAFSEGAGHVSAMHETVKMVELATKENMGVVMVSIGYRLNWHGFLTCRDLVEENQNSDGPVLNYGLHDQRNAFKWIKKYISGFGGDPNNVTAFGESAGSISLAYHMCSNVPLFERVIMQSGNNGTVEQWKMEQYEEVYQRLLNYLGIHADTGSERLQLLRDVPAARLVDAIRELKASPFHPYMGAEGAFCPMQPNYGNQNEIMPKCDWIGDVMLGDCTFEGFIFSGGMQMVDPLLFAMAVKDAFGSEDGTRVLEAYGIDAEGRMDGNLFFTRSMEFMGDLLFSEPTHSLANALSDSASGEKRKVYRYTFGLPNPFPGSMYSYVVGHHFIDVLYLFMTLDLRYPPHRDNFYARQATDMARKWIRFGNGLPPWPNEYDAREGNIAVCDDLRGWQIRTRQEDEKTTKSDPWGPRRYKGWEAIGEAFKRIGKSNEDGTKAERIEAARRKLGNMRSYRKKD
ncbi:hypothetical protein MMC34_008063 [Xylographa carneopallida]|nr:hypothetical protein [Xylographa carneopallida]